MYWRRFALSSIPLDDTVAFEKWLKNVWLEKEDLLEQYIQNGRFPANGEIWAAPENVGSSSPKAERGAPFFETKVQLASWFEIAQIFVVPVAMALVCNVIMTGYKLIVYGSGRPAARYSIFSGP